ncbi:MAG: hypothetical protein IPI90_17800 [Saprospiraceae bacterium]|nr:hypothetical protein [Candidatus Vicinibacter affinis]
MKYFFLTVHLCFFSILYSQSVKQNSKGVSPIGNNELQNSIHKNTYAVVVGISDYQDKDIPDLRFADKDAEAFAYFSGHGDVEGKKISQPGFLLAWDAPSRVYMGGGTYSLSFLQEVVTTLTVQSKAKVLVITDACHAGKLAGSQIGGAQLTTANLAKQYANEMKILSCQPNEFSLEGPQWGGGRGVFSYHLVEGLFGLADRNNDGQITLGEIDRYLEDHVTGEAAPQSQVPILLGNKTDRIATVNASILAELKRNKTGSMQVFASTDSRGFEEEMLSKVDTSIRDIYKNFKLAVLEKRFLEPAGNCAEDYYTLLIQVEALLPLRGIMKRNYAAALQDDAQQVINDWIKIGGDHFTLSRIKQIEKYKNYPSLLNRAAALLGSEHYFYKPLIARKYFFEAYLLRMINPVNFDEELGKKVLNMLRTSLFYDSDFPQTFWLMSITHAYNLWKSDSANYYALKAVSLAPTWALPFNDLANFHNHISLQDSKVYELLNQARAIDSNMVSTSFNRPKLLDSLHGASYSKTVTINLKHEISFQYAFVLPA